MLRDREMNVGEIVSHFELTQPTVSHHLGLLRRAGVVLARREGKHVYYRANRCCLDSCTRRLIEPFVARRHNSGEEPP
jgi:DNA-binding transcriptional ArsR family regulator